MRSSLLTETANGRRWRPLAGDPLCCSFGWRLCKRYQRPEDLEIQKLANGDEDRNADGDFLHACTEPFAERLLFEAVQRVGGYDAYGTPNAPARLAALVQQQTPVPG